MSSTVSADTATPVRHAWLAVSAIALAIFSVVTTEMLPIGLLTPIAHALDTSTGTAGLMVSLPALLAAVFAPLVVIASAGIDRRTILCGLLGLLTLANIASALTTSMGWMLTARVLVGFCMGGIWAIAGSLASRLVPGHRIGLATSIIFGGVAAASVLGAPLSAWIGEIAGWRWAFAGMAMLSTLVLILHVTFVPALPAAGSATLRQFATQLGNRNLQVGLLLTVLLVTGHFMAFTFVRPLLLSVSGFEPHWLSALLFAYGIAGIAGNFLVGIAAARHTTSTLTAIALGLLLTLLLLLSIGASPLGGGMVLLLWGLAYGGVSVGLMTWMMKAAPKAMEVATALYVGTFNVGIALGAWVGGRMVDGCGLTGNLWLAVGFAAAASLLVIAMRWSARVAVSDDPASRH